MPVGKPLIALLWAVLGALLSGLLAASYRFEAQTIPWLSLAAWFLVWLAWIPLGSALGALVKSHPVSRQNWRLRAPPYLLGGLLLTTALLTIRLLADRGLHSVTGIDDLGAVVNALLVQSVVFDALIYVGILALAHALNYSERYARRLVESTELEARLSRVRLAFLRNQMQPHFVLNTLNLISALIYTDTDKADRMIADLGDLLRVTMEDAQQQEVPLRREMEYLDHSLHIARTRFGSTLRVERQIADELNDALVPSLVLQPLVENALRYGLAERNGKSRISIEARRAGSSLRLEVSDNGPGLPLAAPGPLRMGLGLGNTRRRLEQLYGEGQRLEIRNRPEGGAVAVLELPYRPQNGSHDNADSGFFYDDPHSYRGRRAAGTSQDQVLPRA